MKTNKQLARHALALAITAMSASSAWAGDVISTAAASIDNLRYRLIDLDPNDGIAPALSINGIWMGSATSWSQLNFFDVGNGGAYDRTEKSTPLSYAGTLPLQGGTATAGLADGTVTSAIGSQQLRMNAQLSTQDLLTGHHVDGPIKGSSYETEQNGQFGTLTYSSTYTKDVAQGYRAGMLTGSTTPGSTPNFLDNYPKLDLQVTAHTLLVVEGTSKVEVTADRSNLVQSVQQSGESTDYVDGHRRMVNVFADGSASALVSASLTDTPGLVSYTEEDGTFSSAVVRMQVNYNESGFFGSSDPSYLLTHSDSHSKDWALQWANLGDADKTVYLSLILGTDLMQRFDSTIENFDASFVPGGVPSIPEPGTCALMGLGLAGMALARRRATQP